MGAHYFLVLLPSETSMKFKHLSAKEFRFTGDFNQGNCCNFQAMNIRAAILYACNATSLHSGPLDTLKCLSATHLGRYYC